MSNNNSETNIVARFLTIVLIIVIGYIIIKDSFFTSNVKSVNTVTSTENFGALQSLYSNDGPQDAYLTVENDPSYYYDPYGYWRGVTWNLPTRNLDAVTFYPYLYERNIDRYGTLYPYWSL